MKKLSLNQLRLWPLRILWLALPALVASVGYSNVAPESAAIATAVEVELWAAWFIGLVATLVPHPISLTTIRIVAPASLLLAVASLFSASEVTASTFILLGASTALTIVVFNPYVGDLMINGSAYGPERRMALRPPGFVLLGPLQILWLIMVAPAFFGPVLLTDRQLIAGGVLTAIALAAIPLASKALHQLSKRWLVFVPAGYVIHDLMILTEPILLKRKSISTLGPALEDPVGAEPAQAEPAIERSDDRLDLSLGGRGLVLQANLNQPIEVGLKKGRKVTKASATEILFTPTLPGAALQEARIRGVKIGEVRR